MPAARDLCSQLCMKSLIKSLIVLPLADTNIQFIVGHQLFPSDKEEEMLHGTTVLRLCVCVGGFTSFVRHQFASVGSWNIVETYRS